MEKRNRIDRLIGLLKSQQFWTTKDLGHKLQVSQRTLMRDLNVIRDMGIPVESSTGRGGGVGISGRFGLSRLELNSKEVIDLLLSIATIEKLNSPMFLHDMKSIKDKIASAFPPEQRTHIENLRKRLYIGDVATQDLLNSYKISRNKNTDVIHNAFFNLSCVTITYVSEKKERLTRTIEPHYLVLNWPIWYILAWDHLRDDIRFFRIDRIKNAKIETERFNLHHSSRFKSQLNEFADSL